jgi:hypothetical protein
MVDEEASEKVQYGRRRRFLSTLTVKTAFVIFVVACCRLALMHDVARVAVAAAYYEYVLVPVYYS